MASIPMGHPGDPGALPTSRWLHCQTSKLDSETLEWDRESCAKNLGLKIDLRMKRIASSGAHRTTPHESRPWQSFQSVIFNLIVACI